MVLFIDLAVVSRDDFWLAVSCEDWGWGTEGLEVSLAPSISCVRRNGWQKQNAAANPFFSMHLVTYSKIMHLKPPVVFNPTKSKENENEFVEKLLNTSKGKADRKGD